MSPFLPHDRPVGTPAPIPLARATALVLALMLAGGTGSGTGCRPAGNEGTAKSPPPHAHAAGEDADHDHDHDHDHDREGDAGHADEHGHGHAHAEEGESPSGARFHPGEGVVLTDETRTILGLEMVEVAAAPFSAVTRFTAQIFGERHHHLPNPGDHSGCDVHGSGLVSRESAAAVTPGDPVEVVHGEGAPLRGVVLGVQTAVALGESEILIGITNAISVLRPGSFVPASVRHPAAPSVLTVPNSAVLRTAEGAFVYAAHEDAYRRTPVRTGPEDGTRTAILDGLQPGDRVVARPVETLWLIELRATKGGGHTH